MAPRKKNPAIQKSGVTSSKAAPLPDWVKGGGPKPPPKYAKGASGASGAGAGAGTSTGAAGAGAGQGSAQPQQQQQQHLWGPGVKTPLNILYERCQKLPGWEKPSVEPRKRGPHFSCVVTLRKANKQDASNPYLVRFEPLEPGVRLECETALEAKHWGATYALFRVFNALPLYRALPPGPREYWLQLEEMKKAAPATQSWMWSSDPFEAAAKREEEKRAREAAAAAVSSSGSGSGGMVINGTRNGGAGAADHKRPLNKAWAEAREVRMAPALREMTEATIRRLMAVFPEAAQPAAVEGDSEADAAGAESVDRARLEKELANLGFRRGHIRSAVEWLCRARESLAQGTAAVDDPLLGALTTMADREAALEYLVLYCPEDDLPVSFRPSAASNPFVTAAGVTGVGVDGLAESWSIDRLVKVAGFPRIAVQEVMQSLADIPREQREGVALDILSRKLVGWDTQEEGRDVWGTSAVMLSVDMLASEDQEVQDERTQKREDERQAVEAVLGDGRVQTVPERERAYAQDFDILISPPADASSADEVRLRVSFHPRSSYPSACSLDTGLDMEAAALPTFYVASSTLPAYLRLALTAHVLRAFRDPEHADWRDMLEAGEGGVLLALVEELESVWAQLVHEPPMVSDIMQHIAPRKPVSQPTQNSTPTNSAQNRPKGAADRSRRRAALKRDAAADSSLLEAQRALHDSSSYQPFKRVRESLPAWGTREDILALLAKQRIIVVTGETGSGKTTQVPQFVLDQAIAEGRGSEINIVVTQPRRVSAMGVAARVAAERCENLEANAGKASSGGAQGLIGYAIRGERRASKNCRLLFTTTGVLLRRLGSGGDNDLSGVSHVVVDEVHERSVDSDFLLLELREVLQRNSKIKIILMSATINQEIFSSYFSGAPCIEIPGRTYPVTDYYLEDIIRETRFRPSQSSRGRPGEKNPTEKQAAALRDSFQAQGLDDEAVRTLEMLSRNDRIDYDLLGAAARLVVNRAEDQEAKGVVEKGVGGAVLIFCPGVGEIRQAVDAVRAAVSGRIDVLPLHANLSPEEQKRVFQPARAGHRKIVVSTNVAETSITIPEVSYVIDTGRVKETRFEPEACMTRLVECWASRAACRQRRGRAGRTRAGECWKLFTRAVEERKMVPQQTPEMRRVPLESLFLQVKAMREDEDVKAFLNKAIDPPSIASMDNALRTLTETGAIESDRGFQSRLTALGKHLSNLPLDLRLGKLLILGSVFGCLAPLLSVAAIMSCKPLFTVPFEKREEANKARAAFSIGNSDLLTDANAFAQWARMRSERRPNGEIRQFCEQNFLSMSTLRDVQSTRLDLLSNLQELGFVSNSYDPLRALVGTDDSKPTPGADAHLDAHSSNINMLKALILAGLWPSVVRIALPSAKYDQGSSGTIQRDAEARTVKYFDQALGRVFLHPSSTLFASASYSSSYLAIFQKSASGEGANSKVYMRDATEVPLYSLLLFGGKLKINHMAGGISVGSPREGDADGDGWVRMRANARIGVLCAQLRRLLDAVMADAVEQPGSMLTTPENQDVVSTMIALITRDGLSAP